MKKTVHVSLNSINKVKSFVDALSQYNADFVLASGHYVVDAKSIMGIFSLDLSKPIELQIDAADTDAAPILDSIKPYIAE